MSQFVRRPNRIEVRGEVTVIYLRVRGEEVECLIDTDDLDLIREYTWCQNTWGYAQTTKATCNPQVLMHVLIMNPPPGMMVDHVHQRTLDNRRSELRVVTPEVNGHNRSRRNTGIQWIENASMWRVRFMVSGKSIGFGCYRERTDAEAAANRIREKIRRGESVDDEYANRPLTRRAPTPA